MSSTSFVNTLGDHTHHAHHDAEHPYHANAVNGGSMTNAYGVMVPGSVIPERVPHGPRAFT